MKQDLGIETVGAGSNAALKAACMESCQKLLDQLARVREGLLAEWKTVLATKERVLQLALNEAEALAWQSGVPQLVFPSLAEEKARAVARWSLRQQSMMNSGRRVGIKG